MSTPTQAFAIIPKELDAPDWQLALDDTDLKVYSKFQASSAPIIGFKTVTEHPVAMSAVVGLLQDVCGAMHQINDLFLKGAVVEQWPIPEDTTGTLVSTAFKMPFPLANREFLHGLHTQQIDASTYLVAYTPIERPDIPVQPQHVRCEMAVSGQRISYLKKGTVQVEHLMVYQLGGNINSYIQDHWLKKSHLAAYAKEWRALRTSLYPAPIEQLDYLSLKALALDSLQASRNWPLIGKPTVGTVRIGRLSYSPKNAFRTDVVVNSPLEKVVQVIADQSLAFLPKWNKEFIEGSILETLEDSPQKAAWIIKVHYQTPAILANREYIYYFSREWLKEGEVLIIYNSIQHPSSPPSGFVRALLYPTVHLCSRVDATHTTIQHILATDLKGKLSNYQDTLLKGGLAQAHCRDMKNQDLLFQQL